MAESCSGWKLEILDLGPRVSLGPTQKFRASRGGSMAWPVRGIHVVRRAAKWSTVSGGVGGVRSYEMQRHIRARPGRTFPLFATGVEDVDCLHMWSITTPDTL